MLCTWPLFTSPVQEEVSKQLGGCMRTPIEHASSCEEELRRSVGRHHRTSFSISQHEITLAKTSRDESKISVGVEVDKDLRLLSACYLVFHKLIIAWLFQHDHQRRLR